MYTTLTKAVLIIALLFWRMYTCFGGLPRSVSVKNHLPVPETGLIPGSERSFGEGDGNLLLYSCLENPMDTGAGWATVHGVTKNLTLLSMYTCMFLPSEGLRPRFFHYTG